MSLRKIPTMTTPRLETNRRNARKPTRPRSTRGRARSWMNSVLGAGLGAARRGGSRTAPTAPARVDCGEGPCPARAEHHSTVEDAKEFFFISFEAGMLLKTQESATLCQAVS